MAEIVLTTLNAKYIHTAFGLRYLLANLGPLHPRARLAEFDINQRPLEIAEAILAHELRIVGFGVYIWNVAPTTEIVATIKRLRPDITVILGGPEVSYETEQQPVAQLADYVITGEADLKFAEVCRALLEDGSRGRSPHQLPKIIPADPPELAQVAMPYDFYTADDIAHRILYVEASRGCPFSCEFCLSSLDIPVRQFPLPQFLAQLQRLLDRGATRFKFVDRTFNLNPQTGKAILEFLLARCRPGHFYHFEIVPDRLPAEFLEITARFPAGTLQFEVGIQTFNEEVAARIQRRQDYRKLEDNLRFLRRETSAHIHADLIFGLPGESLESFADGFDRLVALGPQEIQVGILKRLRGVPIVRHDAEWQMVYNPNPPYEILQNKLVNFVTLQKVRRFARYWDLVGNSGNFTESTPLIWSSVGRDSRRAEAENESRLAGTLAPPSPFYSFLRFSDWLFARVGRTDSIALVRLMQLLFEYLTGELKLDTATVAGALARDYRRLQRPDLPGFLKEHLPAENKPTATQRPKSLKPGVQLTRKV